MTQDFYYEMGAILRLCLLVISFNMHCISIELPVIISIGKFKKFKIIKFSIIPRSIFVQKWYVNPMSPTILLIGF